VVHKELIITLFALVTMNARGNQKTATRAVFKGANKVTSLTPALVTTVRAASFPT
jgi:hypothetical protein